MGEGIIAIIGYVGMGVCACVAWVGGCEWSRVCLCVGGVMKLSSQDSGEWRGVRFGSSP